MFRLNAFFKDLNPISRALVLAAYHILGVRQDLTQDQE
jgi:hypothetical protein